jgi:hypothetical protein
VLLRLSYLAVSSVFTVMGLLPVSDTAKDIETLAMRHQLAILQRQDDTPRLTSTDRACLAALLHRLPWVRLRQLQLIVSSDTILRWHRDLSRRRHRTSPAGSVRDGHRPAVPSGRSCCVRPSLSWTWGASDNADQPQDQLSDLAAGRGPTWAPTRVGPRVGDQLAVPAQQRRWGDQFCRDHGCGARWPPEEPAGQRLIGNL